MFTGARWTRCRLLFAALVFVLGAAIAARAQDAPGSLVDPELLSRAGIASQQFAQRMGLVRYTEHLSQRELRDDGKVNYQQDAFFDALTLLRRDNGGFVADESAVKARPSAGFELRPLLHTSGFSTFAMFLHPDYAPSFQFTALEDETVSGQRLRVLQFEHIKGADSPTALKLHGREYPLEFFGTVWLDAESAAVVRVVAALEEPVEEVGLRDLRCDIRYASVRLPEVDEAYWLPSSATIDLQTQKQHWRNIHSYSNFRKYSVDVTVGTGEGK
jgi:hypothetical protein